MAIAQRIGADAHDAHVDVFFAVQVPHFATLGLAEVSRPFFGQKHLSPFGQEHVSARDYLLGTLPKFLTGTHF